MDLMPIIYLIYPFLLTSGLLFAFLLLVLTLKHRKHQLSQAVIGIALTGFGINLSTLLSMYASIPTQAIWWHGPVRLAVYAFIAPVGLVIVSAFIQQRNSTYSKLFPGYAIFAIPVTTALLSLTNSFHHWFIRSYTMEQINGYFIRTAWAPGPWFWLHTLYSYVLSAAMLWVLVVWVRQTHDLPRWRGLLVLFVVILSVGALSLDQVGINFAPGLLITPVSFGIMNFLFLIGIWYLDLLDVLPIARETLISHLSDAVLITDANNQTLDINTPGEALLGRPLSELRGKDVLQFLDPENLKIARNALDAKTLDAIISVKVQGETRWFDLRVNSIFLEGTFLASKVITLRDITEMRTLQERDRELAAFEERQRLARDLHDAVSQTLFSARLTSDMLLKQRETIQPDFLWKSIAHISNLVKGALGEMRILLLELRPESLQNAEIATLLAHLTDAASSQTEADIHLEKQIQSQLPVNVKTAFYRIAQEALNNIIKHANASNVSIRIVCRDDLAELTVEDDGQGFDLDNVSGSQLGLKIMCERADEAGIQLDIHTKPQQGTRITCFWKA